MSDLLRICGRCGDLWPIHAVKCARCDKLLVLTVPARIEDRHGRRAA